MQNEYSLTWDLDTIFKGGSSSDALTSYIKHLEHDMDKLDTQISQFEIPREAEDTKAMIQIIDLLENNTKQLGEISAFISCLAAQNVEDDQVKIIAGKRNELSATYTSLVTTLDQLLVSIEDDVWAMFIKQPSIQTVAFVLNERRQQALNKLPLDQEILLNDLAINGYHAWGEMYDTIVGKMTVNVTAEDGSIETLSVGQAANRMDSPNRKKRQEAFEQLEKAWKDNATLFTDTLNNLAGFRLQTYKHRKWDNVLKEPLTYNRMSEHTLQAMWEAITKNKTPFVSYLKRKADLLGVDKLNWYDLEAPITTSTKSVDYDQAARTIINQFHTFSPQMAQFATHAFENRWIEAEDRAGKRPGGFCTSFPDSKQTRIFMTYSGSSSNVATLAHELGHGFHQYVMDDLEILNQDYAMNVAETASTFAEMVVADAAVRNAANDEEKIALLEDKIQRSVAFFMNIHARFLFETRFYEERKKGVVSTSKLNELMEEAQREAYCGELGQYNPTFWASKLHFHITDVPFYNFPYTFGYLFSLGIYAEAMENKDDFEQAYISLLQDTGRMTVEDLARKHLGVELNQLDFWEKGISLCQKDVEEFLRLTDRKVK